MFLSVFVFLVCYCPFLSFCYSFLSFSNSFCLSSSSSDKEQMQTNGFVGFSSFLFFSFLLFFFFLFLLFFSSFFLLLPFFPFRQGTSKIICLFGANACTPHLLRYVAWNEHNWKKESLHVFFVGCQACPDLNRFDLGREILYTYVFFTSVPLRPLVTPPLVKPGAHDRYRREW